MTTSRIFGENAPLYWARNLSVVPVEPETKRPAGQIGNWAGYCNNRPSDTKQQEWLASFGRHNIGLLTNMEISPGFALGAVDVDRDELIRVSKAILGNPVTGKRGKKGATFFVRVPREDKVRKTTLMDHEKVQAVDILVGNSHTVIPPSIHPETGAEYTWIGKPLIECEWSELPVLDRRRLDLLKLIVSSEFTPALLLGGGTHDAGVRLVAQLVGKCADEGIAHIFRALLPTDYAGNSLEELPGWIASARAKGFEQSEDGGSETTLSAKIVSIAIEAGVELFHDGEYAFASVPATNGILTYPIGSSAFQQWLRHQTYKSMERPISRGTLSDAIATLEANALYQGAKHPVEIRVAGDNAAVEIDLGQTNGQVVRITASGWDLAQKGERRFYRASGFEPLPEPARGGSLSALQSLLGLEEASFYLFTSFLVNALRPTGPYMALLVEGEQGSGKSFLCHAAKMLIDPNRASKLRLPDNERDLMIQAKEYRLLVYDNASGMRADMSDALCTLATGGGLGVRRLYTNDELQVLSYSRPLVINGISGYASRPDLLERAIPLRLQSMQVEGRRTEGEMLADFERVRPAILGALYDAVSSALRHYTETETPMGLRMADAARWIAAAEAGLGITPGTLTKAMSTAQEALFIERINDESLVIAIREVLTAPLRNREFNGYVGELFKLIEPARDKALPKTTQQLSAQLVRLRQAMAKAGLHVEFKIKDKRGRKIRIWSSIELEPTPSKPSIYG
ncbi:bifunctional DNA primase/polymerase [Microvirga terrestris]|uniref:Bifunctional DNA primase/polymerase n=1 Tax=Microvirga terrestris TaxID=2791024 RepID=A0ABS0HRS2_9HYPH|nr:bifunctional DNA primase/polymerase [Microvirga terrestris]MBF9196104.1 bifunctional DNA primase/polymerase [Microvirga terrestris]